MGNWDEFARDPKTGNLVPVDCESKSRVRVVTPREARHQARLMGYQKPGTNIAMVDCVVDKAEFAKVGRTPNQMRKHRADMAAKAAAGRAALKKVDTQV